MKGTIGVVLVLAVAVFGCVSDRSVEFEKLGLIGAPLHDGVRVDEALRRGWEHDRGRAAFTLWRASQEGRGLPMDGALGDQFLDAAAKAGHPDARRENIRWFATACFSTDDNDRTAFEAYQGLAAEGDFDAAYDAACVLRHWRQLEDEEFWSLVETAAAQGSRKAQRRLAREWKTRKAGRLWLVDLARERDAEFCLILGRARETGDGMPQSVPDAYAWYFAAWLQDSEDGAWRAAKLLLAPGGDALDLDRAESILIWLANRGHAQGMFELGRRWMKEPYWADKGLAYIRRAALTRRCPDARAYLAALYLNEPADSAESHVRIGECHENRWGVKLSDTHFETALDHYLSAARLGSAEGHYRAARMYLLQYPTMSFDMDEGVTLALQHLRAAADGGWAPAQLAMGLAHTESWRTDQFTGDRRPSESVRWFRLAAKSDDPRAQLALGRCYERGYGVAASRKRALDWYARAARDRGVLATLERDDLMDTSARSEALVGIGRLTTDGSEVGTNRMRGISCLRLAFAEAGSREAASLLGAAYAAGRGVPKHADVAAAWRRAALPR